MATPDSTPSDSKSSSPVVTTVPDGALEQPRRLLFGRVPVKQMVSAFQHRNYRFFFSGQIVSLTGTWMQFMAEGWLVYTLTKSELAMGTVRFIHTIPITIFAFFAGTIADRVNKRKILLVTQSISMVLAFALFGLVRTDHVQLWQIGVISFLMGMTHAFDIPARQSFVVEMVGKKDLMNAIALNSSVFNGARMIGPAIAGKVIAWLSVASCFLMNAISYLAVIIAYLCIKTDSKPNPPNPDSTFRQNLEAFRFILSEPKVRSLLLLITSASLLILPYPVLMPIFAVEVLGLDASGFGLLMSATGIGAFLGAISLASLGDYPHKQRLVFIGVLGLTISLFVFALSSVIWLSTLMLAFAGWFMIIFFSTANTLVQSSVPDTLRGRVMGIYSFCFLGVSPFGSLLTGAISKKFGVSVTLSATTAICFVVALVISLRLGKRID